MMSTEDKSILPPQLWGDDASVNGTVHATLAAKPSKSALVTKLLRRAKGATLAELQEATAWQPHSVRAFLSGLRKKGAVTTKEQRKSGETAYRLAGKSLGHEATDA